MLGNDKPDMGDYKDWIEPLLSLDFWKNFEPWGVEFMLCDLEKSVGGQLDLLGYDKKEKKIILIDLKTQGNKYAKPYSTNAQLGSYVDALKIHRDIKPDVCKTIWAKPNKCVIGEDQEVELCTREWRQAWEKFKAKQEVF